MSSELSDLADVWIVSCTISCAFCQICSHHLVSQINSSHVRVIHQSSVWLFFLSTMCVNGWHIGSMKRWQNSNFLSVHPLKCHHVAGIPNYSFTPMNSLLEITGHILSVQPRYSYCVGVICMQFTKQCRRGISNVHEYTVAFTQKIFGKSEDNLWRSQSVWGINQLHCWSNVNNGFP